MAISVEQPICYRSKLSLVDFEAQSGKEKLSALVPAEVLVHVVYSISFSVQELSHFYFYFLVYQLNFHGKFL